jgi:outer membrane protein OmpA-like peptidoglycan-associated protein
MGGCPVFSISDPREAPMKSEAFKIIALLACMAWLTGGCSTGPDTGKQPVNKNAVGGFTGKTKSRQSRNRALQDAGIRRLSYGSVGAYMDKQEARLRKRLQRTGVSISRTGNHIILNMPGRITFDFGSANLKSEYYEILNAIAMVFEDFGKTYIDVYGHTDSIGSQKYNYKLSYRRANCVAEYLIAQGCNSHRFSIQGLGETRPVASNASKSGRSQNRRVEIEISPLT